jgi:hypothetical protein
MERLPSMPLRAIAAPFSIRSHVGWCSEMKFGEIALYVMLTAGGAFRVSASSQRAVRSRYVPLYLPIATELLAGFRIFPAICNLQGDFQKLQGEPILLAVKCPNYLKTLEGVLAT